MLVVLLDVMRITPSVWRYNIRTKLPDAKHHFRSQRPLFIHFLQNIVASETNG
jgi:hypothetical protein